VASAVTDSSREILEAFAERRAAGNPQLLTLAVSRREFRDGQWQKLDKRPVTLLRLGKPEKAS
jgi:hypothetical protein